MKCCGLRMRSSAADCVTGLVVGRRDPEGALREQGPRGPGRFMRCATHAGDTRPTSRRVPSGSRVLRTRTGGVVVLLAIASVVFAGGDRIDVRGDAIVSGDVVRVRDVANLEGNAAAALGDVVLG